MKQLERNTRTTRQLAMALGQDEALLNKIEDGETHPVMAAFGLWQLDPTFDNLVDEIYRARRMSQERPGVEL